MKSTSVLFTVFMLFSTLSAMDRLPADLIRDIAKKAMRSASFSDSEKAFTLQSMAGVNSRWFQALAALKTQDFPYLSF